MRGNGRLHLGERLALDLEALVRGRDGARSPTLESGTSVLWYF